MGKNSTLKLWDQLLSENSNTIAKKIHKTQSEKQDGPKKETIDTILAYASSVKGIKTKSIDTILISLN